MPFDTYLQIADVVLTSFEPAAGTPTGKRAYLVSPTKGRLYEVGYTPNSVVASAITLAVAIGAQTSSAASSFTQCISSTLATVSSTNLVEGLTQGFQPAATTLVEDGDTIQFTFSGGNTSAIGATIYAIIRRTTL